MIDAAYELTFRERIEGPFGPTIGAPKRLCWRIAEATLTGPRVNASLATPGIDWIRLEPDGTRRQDQRAQFLTDDGVLILMRYDTAIIRGDDAFAAALASGRATQFGEQYMYAVPQFEVSDDRYAWLTQSLFLGRGRLAGAKQIEYELHRLR